MKKFQKVPIATFISTYMLWIILFLAAVVRLWQLGTIPYGISNDEAGYIYSSYSILKTGNDVSGKFLPISINLDNSSSPVYIYTTIPFLAVFGLTPFAGRLAFALLGIATVLVFYFLVKEFFNNRKIALLSAFLLAVSPWHILLSRGALDANFALFFYLLGIFVFVKGVKKGAIYCSLPIFLLAFYSYHATKIYFIFLIPILLVFYAKQLFVYKKQTLLFIFGCILIVASFLYVIKTQGVTRQAVLFSNNENATTVDNERNRNYNSSPEQFKAIFNNKLLYQLRFYREYYLEAFSPQFLFLYGEPSGLKLQFSLLSRGQLYIIELLFLFIGLYSAFRYKKTFLPFLLLLIAPLPSVFAIFDKSYVNRSIMMLPFLLVYVSLGIYYFFDALQNHSRLLRNSALAIIVVLYVFLISSFLYQYFFRFNHTGSEGWFGSSRELSYLIGESHGQYNKVYVDGAGEMFLLQYGIFNKIEPTVIQKAWKKHPNSSIGNVYFINTCSSSVSTENPTSLYKKNTLLVVRDNCYKQSTPSATIVDRGEFLRTIWKIYKIQ